MNDLEKSLCPVCGYRFDGSIYDDETGEIGEDYNICPSCGFAYSVTDIDKGFTFTEWRHQWISNGMQFKHIIAQLDSSWNPIEQLKGIGVELDSSNNILKEPEEPEWHKNWIHKD